MMTFKEKYSFEERNREAERIMKKYTNRIPIVVEIAPNTTSLPPLDKNKYLVPSDITIGQFLYVIRKRVQIDSTEALFIFINKTLPNHSDLIVNIYENHADKDGFLYIQLSSESTYGH